ncbi:MAG: sensory rhodopsin transducer [Cyanobacteriota bacterium]
MIQLIGHIYWAILLGKRFANADGSIPASSSERESHFSNPETVRLLNTSDRDAGVEIRIFFSNKESADLYRVTVPAQRDLEVHFNDLIAPESIHYDSDFASVIKSDVPILVQPTRLDSLQANNALLSRMADANSD